MKHILNVLKNEIFNQNKQTDGLVKKITASQEAYLKDRKNEKLFNVWSENVKGLQKVESNQRYLLSAYAWLTLKILHSSRNAAVQYVRLRVAAII